MREAQAHVLRGTGGVCPYLKMVKDTPGMVLWPHGAHSMVEGELWQADVYPRCSSYLEESLMIRLQGVFIFICNTQSETSGHIY